MLIKSIMHAIIFSVPLIAAPAFAQSISSVSGATISPDTREAEYRFGISENGTDESYSHRFGYGGAISETLRLRGKLALSSDDFNSPEFSYFETDLLWHFYDADRFDSSLRLDVRYQDGNSPNRIGVNTINQLALDENWLLRFMLSLDAETGHAARSGLFAETRASLSRKFENGLRVGADLYNNYGNSDIGFGAFEDQRHVAGISVTGPGPQETSWTLGFLTGLSDSAPDQVFQFRLQRRFDAH